MIAQWKVNLLKRYNYYRRDCKNVTTICKKDPFTPFLVENLDHRETVCEAINTGFGAQFTKCGSGA